MGLVITVAVLATLFVTTTAVFSYKIYKLEKTVALMGEFLITSTAYPESVDVIEEIFKPEQSDVHFPNSEGGF